MGKASWQEEAERRREAIAAHIAAYPGLTSTQVARALRIPSNKTAEKLLRELEAAGLAVRSAGPADPRWGPVTVWSGAMAGQIGEGHVSGQPVDQDDRATWRQLLERLREIRCLADASGGTTAKHVLAILDRPREE